MKKVAIIGGTGLIGRHLANQLAADGFIPVIVSRRKSIHELGFPPIVKHIQWDGISSGELAAELSGFYGVINLAGEGIGDKLWNPNRKKHLLESRYGITKNLVSALALMHKKPKVLIQGSAVGYYGPKAVEAHEGSPNGKGFLAELSFLWESAAYNSETLNIRTVYIRTGVVLSNKGGAFPKLILPFKWFVGGNVGSPSRMIPWIHIDDEVRAISFLLNSSSIHGAVNLVAPQPCTQRELNTAIANNLKRPYWMRIPAFLFRILPGDMGKELLLSDQSIYPTVLRDAGFRFRFETIGKAVDNLFTRC